MNNNTQMIYIGKSNRKLLTLLYPCFPILNAFFHPTPTQHEEKRNKQPLKSLKINNSPKNAPFHSF